MGHVNMGYNNIYIYIYVRVVQTHLISIHITYIHSTMKSNKKTVTVEYQGKQYPINRPSDLNDKNDPKHLKKTGFVYTCGDNNCQPFCLSKQQYGSILTLLGRKRKNQPVTLKKLNGDIWMQFTMPADRLYHQHPCLMCLKRKSKKGKGAICVADAQKKKSSKKQPTQDMSVSNTQKLAKVNAIPCEYLICSEHLSTDSCVKKHSQQHLAAYRELEKLLDVVKQGNRLEWSKIHNTRLSLTLFKAIYDVSLLESILMRVKNQLDVNMYSEKSGTISTKLSEQLKVQLKAFLDKIKDYTPQKKAPPGFQLSDFVAMKPAQQQQDQKNQTKKEEALKEERDTLQQQVYELEGHVSYLNDRLHILNTTTNMQTNELESMYTKVDRQDKTIKEKEAEIMHLYARLAQFQNQVNHQVNHLNYTIPSPNAWTKNNGNLTNNFVALETKLR